MSPQAVATVVQTQAEKRPPITALMITQAVAVPLCFGVHYTKTWSRTQCRTGNASRLSQLNHSIIILAHAKWLHNERPRSRSGSGSGSDKLDNFISNHESVIKWLKFQTLWKPTGSLRLQCDWPSVSGPGCCANLVRAPNGAYMALCCLTCIRLCNCVIYIYIYIYIYINGLTTRRGKQSEPHWCQWAGPEQPAPRGAHRRPP